MDDRAAERARGGNVGRELVGGAFLLAALALASGFAVLPDEAAEELDSFADELLMGLLDQPLPAARGRPAFHAIEDVREKKRAFYDFLLPMIREENTRIRAQRAFVSGVAARVRAGEDLDAAARRRLDELAAYYEVNLDDDRPRPEAIETLMRRVDIVPPSLALAQAASESAWGASRFARAGNNFFGEWCFSEGCGLVPKRRSAGASHEVERFESVRASVRSYVENLNTNAAYRPLRELRAQLRAEGRALSGRALAEGLARYSERGAAYIREIRSIIAFNRLERFDPVREPTELAAAGAGA